MIESVPSNFFLYPDGDRTFTTRDDQLAALFTHIQAAWEHREIATTHAYAPLMALGEHPPLMQRMIEDVNYQLVSKTTETNRVVLSKELTWYYTDDMWFPSNGEPRNLIRIPNPDTLEALTHARSWVTVVVKLRAIVIPAPPDGLGFASRQQDFLRDPAPPPEVIRSLAEMVAELDDPGPIFGPRDPNEPTQDAMRVRPGQTYPLEGLLNRIDRLTADVYNDDDSQATATPETNSQSQ